MTWTGSKPPCPALVEGRKYTRFTGFPGRPDTRKSRNPGRDSISLQENCFSCRAIFASIQQTPSLRGRLPAMPVSPTVICFLIRFLYFPLNERNHEFSTHPACLRRQLRSRCPEGRRPRPAGLMG